VKRNQQTALYLACMFLLGTLVAMGAQPVTTTVRDLPFTANEWVTRTSTAPDGTSSVTTQQIGIARDLDGTVRREIHESSPGSDRVVGRPIVLVSILNQDTKTSAATFQGKAAVTAMNTAKSQSVSRLPGTKNTAAKPVNSTARREVSTLNGRQAVVYRSQYTVPASTPNEKARTVTSTFWYSPELRVALKSSISDSGGTAVDTLLDDIHQK
jgi:hypothetical protein